MDKDMEIITPESIEQLIFMLRGQKVMLDRDLAQLYCVEIRALKQAVRRNIKRFPSDFMLELTKEEERFLRSQNVILKRGQHSKYLSFAFTEQGVAMLSSVLNSERAVQVNIEIMRAFVRIRQMLSAHKDLERRLDALEERYDEQFKVVFDAIRTLMVPPEKPKKKIGFEVKEGKAVYGKKEKAQKKASKSNGCGPTPAMPAMRILCR